MTLDVERRQRQLDRFTITGLVGLSLGSLAGGLREFGLGDWITRGGGVDRVLAAGWVFGLLVFGLAFTALYLVGTRLESFEKAALEDELAQFLSRRAAVFAFVITFVTAVIFTAIPAASSLSGRGVAMIVVAMAAGALAVGRGRTS